MLGLAIRGLGRFVAAVDGNFTVPSGSRIIENLTPVDLDAQSGTITAAIIKSGILVHTSVTGAGVLTTDTALNIIATCGLTVNGDSIRLYIVNDGTQSVTLAAGVGVTLADAGPAIAADEGAVVVFRRVSSTTVTAYIIGA